MKLLKAVLVYLSLATYTTSNSQSLVSFSPDSSVRNTVLTTTITGSNTNFTQGSNTVHLVHSQASSTLLLSASALSNTQINAVRYLPSNMLLGYWDLRVNNSVNGLMTLNNALYILPDPYISSITPDSAIYGQTLWVTITAQNANFTQGSSVSNVRLEQGSTVILNSTATTVLNSDQIKSQFSIPLPYNPGNHTLKIPYLNLEYQYLYIQHGNSSIGGNISSQAKAATKVPVPDLLLYLMSSKNDTLRSLKTDVNGDFEFTHLPYGTYYIHAKGLDNSDPIKIVLSASNPNASGLEITLSDDKLISSVQKLNKGSFEVFPNPYKDELYVTLNYGQPKSINIVAYDITGKVYQNLLQDELISGKQVLRFNTSGWKNNTFYILNIEISGEETRTLKLFKKE